MEVLKWIGIFLLCALIFVGLVLCATGIASLITKTSFVEVATVWGKACLTIFKKG